MTEMENKVNLSAYKNERRTAKACENDVRI